MHASVKLRSGWFSWGPEKGAFIFYSPTKIRKAERGEIFTEQINPKNV